MAYVTRDGFEEPERYPNDELWKFLYMLAERYARRFIRDPEKRSDFISDLLAYVIPPLWPRLFDKPEHSIQAFIAQAVEWAFLKKVRREKYQPTLLEDITKLEFLPRAGRAPDPAKAIEAKDAIIKAWELAGLSDYEWKVYLLSEVGWSYTEIAELLGKSKATIRTAVCRARQKIEEFLINQGNLIEKV